VPTSQHTNQRRPCSTRVEHSDRYTLLQNAEYRTHRRPKESHTATIILLHGRDSIASEFAEALPEIFPTTRWVFPTSKIRDSSQFTVSMCQWFDIWSVEDPLEKTEIQIDGLREIVREILDLVQYEATLIAPRQIILGRISQGCATAIHALLHGRLKLSRFIGLSSWLPFEAELSTALVDNTPWSIFLDRLHSSDKILDIPSDRAEVTAVFSDPSILAALKIRSFWHIAGTMKWFLLRMEKGWHRH
jgi:predicted esterase